MGFYLKKSFSLGPLRINLSKSGVGLSLGIKGLRIGTGPNGNYVHAGRKGIYYKKSLSDVNCGESQFVINWFVIIALVLVLGFFYIKLDANLFDNIRSILREIKSS